MTYVPTPSSPGNYNRSLEHNISRLDEHRIGQEVLVQFGAADTEVEIPHGLGVIPRKRWIVTYKDIAGIVYDSAGGTAWDATNAYLKCDTLNLKAVVRFELPDK